MTQVLNTLFQLPVLLTLCLAIASTGVLAATTGKKLSPATPSTIVPHEDIFPGSVKMAKEEEFWRFEMQAIVSHEKLSEATRDEIHQTVISFLADICARAGCVGAGKLSDGRSAIADDIKERLQRRGIKAERVEITYQEWPDKLPPEKPPTH